MICLQCPAPGHLVLFYAQWLKFVLLGNWVSLNFVSWGAMLSHGNDYEGGVRGWHKAHQSQAPEDIEQLLLVEGDLSTKRLEPGQVILWNPGIAWNS